MYLVLTHPARLSLLFDSAYCEGTW